MFVVRFRKLLNVVLALWLLGVLAEFVEPFFRGEDEIMVALRELKEDEGRLREMLATKEGFEKENDESMERVRKELDAMGMKVDGWIGERRELWSWWKNLVAPLCSLVACGIGFYVLNSSKRSEKSNVI